MLPIAIVAAAVLHRGVSENCADGVEIDSINEVTDIKFYGAASLKSEVIEVIPGGSFSYEIKPVSTKSAWN